MDTLPVMPLPVPDDLAGDLVKVEQIIHARLHGRPIVAQTASAALRGAEKPYLRAALVMLAARLGRYESRRVIHAAAAAELIHIATTVHDSLINEAARRRGESFGDQRWNGDVALMSGDYLLALAASEMALAPDARIIGMYARAVMIFCEGRLAPITAVAPLDQALGQHEHVAESRTAALFETAARVGVVCGGGDDALASALGRFGRELGMAMHVAAEVYDYEMDGNNAGRDLRAGRITLPLIYAVDAGGGPDLAAVVDQRPLDAPRLTVAIDQVRRLGIPQARARMREYAQRAVAALTHVPPGAVRDALAALAERVARV
ncbi:MAG: polyprenyl synthetase family protein [Roseiflexaceae bacterium]|nr:polyprenyl synthetase family protein [Roseiflexus sp.]MDW8212572.1 polyprenyl synthetase family protein [Roseiflexaceae bacterium]